MLLRDLKRRKCKKRHEELEDDIKISDFIVSVETREGEFRFSKNGELERVKRNEELLFLEREEVLARSPGGEIDTFGHFDIPDGVEVIGREAFKGAVYLRRITIPEGVIMIQAEAFSGCHHLEFLELPDTLQCIDDRAFEACRRLRTLRIPDGVEVIGREAFKDCTGLEKLIVGDGVQCIEERAFESCKNLKTVRFGRELQVIEQYAFSSCRELGKIRFPRDGELQHLWQSAFGNTRRGARKTMKLPKRYRRCPPYGEIGRAFERTY